MALYADKNRNPVLEKEPFTDSQGVKYPPEYPKKDISDLTMVSETAAPTDSTLVVEGFHIDETFTQVWDCRAKTEQELAADEIAAIRMEITNLENSVTARRMREAALTEEGKTWLQGVDDEIALARASLLAALERSE
jgi:hypothetical protein